METLSQSVSSLTDYKLYTNAKKPPQSPLTVSPLTVSPLTVSPLTVSLKSTTKTSCKVSPDCSDSDDEACRTESQRRKKSSVDGSWSWVMLAGSFYITGFIISITPAFGVLFSQKIAEMEASSSAVSWAFALHGVSWNFGILMTNPLIGLFGYRKTALVGCFFTSTGFMLLAFATSFAYIFVFYAFIIPICAGIGSTVSFFIIPLYFEKRRGLALAILMTGIGFCGIITPLLIRALQDEYGFLGATLLHGALLLNSCVAAALYRTPVNRNYRRKLIIDEEKQKHCSITDTSVNYENKDSVLKYKIYKRIEPLLKRVLNIINTLKDRRILLTGFSIATALVCSYNFLRIVPFLLESKGHSRQFSAQCVSAFYVANTVSRFAMSLLADRKWFRRRSTLISGMIVSAVFAFVFSIIPSSKPVMIAFILAYGTGVGIFLSLYHVNLIDLLGMDLYAECIGCNALVTAFTYATIGFLTSVVEDMAGSYIPTLIFCAVMHLFSAAAWMMLPWVTPREQTL